MLDYWKIFYISPTGDILLTTKYIIAYVPPYRI